MALAPRVKSPIFGRGEVGEARYHLHVRAGRQIVAESGNLALHETEAVHSGVEFYVYGEVAYPFGLENFHQRLERRYVRNGGLETVPYHLPEEIGSRSEDHNRHRYTGFAEFDAFHRQGHGQVIGPGRLHQSGEFHRPVPVRIGLYQHQQAGVGLKQRTEIPVVPLCGRQAQFEA